jgi:hypothetical protein
MLSTCIKFAAVLGLAGAIAFSIAPAEAKNARKKTGQSAVTTGQTTYPYAVRRSFNLDYRNYPSGGSGLMMGRGQNGGPA